MVDRDILDLLERLAVAFPTAQLPEGTILAYHDELLDLEIQDLSQAVTQAIRTCKWWPSIAELRELAAASAEHRRDRARAAKAMGPDWEEIRRVQAEGATNPKVIDARARLKAMLDSIGKPMPEGQNEANGPGVEG